MFRHGVFFTLAANWPAVYDGGMIKSEALEVAAFPSPFDEPESVQEITKLTDNLLEQSIPAFQIDIGDSLVGYLAVRQILETRINECRGDALRSAGLPEWRLLHDSMLGPYALKPYFSVTNTLAPHHDTAFSGVAVHREYMSPQPFPVQFAFTEGPIVQNDRSFKSANHFTGKHDVGRYADTVWEGETQSGRLTIFSEGKFSQNPLGTRPALHFFDRRGLRWTGVYNRYACPHPDRVDWSNIPYDDFVGMRRHASNHFEYMRWEKVVQEVVDHKDVLDPQIFDEMYERAETQLAASEQYRNYRFWSIGHGLQDEIAAPYSYGVLSDAHPETQSMDAYWLRRKPDTQPSGA